MANGFVGRRLACRECRGYGRTDPAVVVDSHGVAKGDQRIAAQHVDVALMRLLEG